MGLHVCRILIASIMEEYNRGAWEELIERCEEAGVDAFEINFSCPHGMPERKMGMAMGQDCQLLEVCSVAAGASCPNSWMARTPASAAANHICDLPAQCTMMSILRPLTAEQ